MNPIKKCLILSIFILATGRTWALDPYEMMKALIPGDKHPRILNSDDVPNLRPDDPQPLFSPSGDFNKDGVEDIAISGVFDLPGAGHKYFLLVGTELKDPFRYEKLYYKEYPEMLFIFRPGTTGEGDPGNQDFSISSCMNCDVGEDFFWDKSLKHFETKKWSTVMKRSQKMLEEPAPQVSDDIVDRALKIVGPLKEIQEFTARMKKEGKPFGVRVEPHGKEKPDEYWVRIFEKKGKEEVLFEKVLVDVKKNAVVRKSRG